MKTPCSNYQGVYDQLIEGHIRGSQGAALIETARHLCGTCPIKKRCHAENADEQWLHVIERGRPVEKRLPTGGDRAAGARRDRVNRLRMAVLHRVSIDTVVHDEGTTRESLLTWTNRHNCRHLYDALVKGTV